MKLSEFVKILSQKKFIKSIINDLKGEVYLVGGALRDILLNKENKDIDLVIRLVTKDELLKQLKNFGKVNLVGESFSVIKLTANEDGLEYDLALPRMDKKNDLGGYKGFDITSDHEMAIEDDLLRRDAKVNAMAVNLNTGKFIDPTGGLDDINNKKMSMTNPDTFSDDPLRMIRVVGFSSRFGFEIEPKTMLEIQKNASKIKEISPERILIEFDKIVKKGNPALAAKLLRQTGLYNYIFGINRGINLSEFENVKTMGEFIYSLAHGAIASPSEFYKKNMKGDLDTYNEIKALEFGGKFNGGRKTVFDMYKSYPESINTKIFGEEFTNTVNYMKTNNIPLSLKEVPVNGNDLMELGYSGKQIGEVFVNLLKQIYSEKLPNDREAILNSLRSNKNVNESIYSVTADDYRSADDKRIEDAITRIVNYKDQVEDGKTRYTSNEELHDFYSDLMTIEYNNQRAFDILAKAFPSNRLSLQYSDNKEKIKNKLRAIGLFR